MHLIAKMYVAGFCAYPFAQHLLAEGVNVFIVAGLCAVFGVALAIAISE